MDIPAHLSFFSQYHLDPAVFMRLLRVLFFAISGYLMWKEPMLCGGKNPSFHRHLAILFGVAAWYNFTIARTRMVLLTANPMTSFGFEFMFLETLYTVASATLVSRLLYDLYKWRMYNKVKEQEPCDICRKTFQP